MLNSLMVIGSYIRNRPKNHIVNLKSLDEDSSECDLMKGCKYQHGFSEQHQDTMYDAERRAQKAKKTFAVIGDYYGGLDKLSSLILLDNGCSTGF